MDITVTNPWSKPPLYNFKMVTTHQKPEHYLGIYSAGKYNEAVDYVMWLKSTVQLSTIIKLYNIRSTILTFMMSLSLNHASDGVAHNS